MISYFQERYNLSTSIANLENFINFVEQFEFHGVSLDVRQNAYVINSGQGKEFKDFHKFLKLLPNLQTLDLRYNDLEGKHMIDHLQHALITTSNLQTLHLEGNSIKCDGATALGHVLASTNTTIQELYLGANQIQSLGIKSLAEDGLRYNTTLKKLYLEGNSIGDEGASALRDVLLEQTNRQVKVLEHLYVDNNGLGKEAAMSLGRAVNSEELFRHNMQDFRCCKIAVKVQSKSLYWQ